MNALTLRRIAFSAIGILFCGQAVQSYLRAASGSETAVPGALGVVFLILAFTTKGG